MSRVFARPTALLDRTPEAAKITEPGTDAEKYVAQNRVTEKIPSLLGLLSLLSSPEMPRLGYVRVGAVANHIACMVQGEDVLEEEAPVRYGFGLSPDGVEEFIELSRLEGDHTQILSFADISDPGKITFREPTLIDVIEDQARIDELNQLLAIAQDAAEWALD